MKIEELTIHPLIEAFLKANNDTVENVKEDIKRGYRAEIFCRHSNICRKQSTFYGIDGKSSWINWQ